MIPMDDITFEKLSAHISDNLAKIKEFSRTVEDIGRNFRNLGLGLAVWHPETIHSANLGGIEAESFIGYSRIEGKWGLQIRTIERDRETRNFVNQRVYPIESCGNMEIVVNGLRKTRELALLISETIDRQANVLSQVGTEFEELRNPNKQFK
jgi:hypothetical protein